MTQKAAMLYGLGAFFIWVVVDTAIKLGSQANLSPFLIMSVMGTVAALTLAAHAYFSDRIDFLLPRSPRQQAFIGLCSIGINIANIVALKHLPLTMFYIVAFTAPLVIAVLSAALKHENLGFIKIVCLIAGFLGVVLAFGFERGAGDVTGYVAAFVGVFCFTLLTLAIRKLPESDSAESTAFMSALCVSGAGLLGLFLQPWGAPEGRASIMMVIAGIINALANILFNQALKNTVSTNVAQLHYTQIIFGAVFAYFLWHEIPTWNLVAGSAIIIVSGMIVAAEAHKSQSLSGRAGLGQGGQ